MSSEMDELRRRVEILEKDYKDLDKVLMNVQILLAKIEERLKNVKEGLTKGGAMMLGGGTGGVLYMIIELSRHVFQK